jgi:hypothetical protein
MHTKHALGLNVSAYILSSLDHAYNENPFSIPFLNALSASLFLFNLSARIPLCIHRIPD